MKKVICSLIIILSLSFCAFPSDRSTDILSGVVSTGIATWSWIEVSKSNSSTKIFIDFVAVYFTAKAVIHFAKAVIE